MRTKMIMFLHDRVIMVMSGRRGASSTELSSLPTSKGGFQYRRPQCRPNILRNPEHGDPPKRDLHVLETPNFQLLQHCGFFGAFAANLGSMRLDVEISISPRRVPLLSHNIFSTDFQKRNNQFGDPKDRI